VDRHLPGSVPDDDTIVYFPVLAGADASAGPEYARAWRGGAAAAGGVLLRWTIADGMMICRAPASRLALAEYLIHCRWERVSAPAEADRLLNELRKLSVG
jgi:hypothetical protein